MKDEEKSDRILGSASDFTTQTPCYECGISWAACNDLNFWRTVKGILCSNCAADYFQKHNTEINSHSADELSKYVSEAAETQGIMVEKIQEMEKTIKALKEENAILKKIVDLKAK